ncbi:glycosyltransferase [Winogradskyella litorisediminis]|uniref:Glycosyltransferase n=1 Tax=Winogradskyella litorisediminis TaxID=1156618 RepID=A0ABW3NBE2_9FLAO
MQQHHLSLIIPVYNAASFIEDTVEKLKRWKEKQDFDVEILIVNDGSSDETETVLKIIPPDDDDFKLISYSKNRGKGYAVKSGMLAATGEVRIFTDADIPYGLDVIHKILQSLLEDNYEVCIGNRLDKDSDYHVTMTFLRKLSSKLFTFFVKSFTIKNVGDTQCGIKGFTAFAANKIFSKTRIDGFAFDVESIYLCYKFNISIKRSPVQFQGNKISTINLFSSSIRMFIDVISLPFRYHILKQYK